MINIVIVFTVIITLIWLISVLLTTLVIQYLRCKPPGLQTLLGQYGLFCLVVWMPSFEGNWVSLMGFSLTYGAGVGGNAPYQAQEL